MGRKHLNKVIELNISLAGIVVFTKMNKLVWIIELKKFAFFG